MSKFVLGGWWSIACSAALGSLAGALMCWIGLTENAQGEFADLESGAVDLASLAALFLGCGMPVTLGLLALLALAALARRKAQSLPYD